MWGTLLLSQRVSIFSRFIPTYVGNTLLDQNVLEHPSVHPHICGEHCASLGWIGIPNGSSPHMWGTLLVSLIETSHRRFIPTYVGNTLHPPLRMLGRKVHPHICGEHLSCSSLLTAAIGSSPHMWGTLLSGLFLYPPSRFIPTYVGNTPHSSV